MVACLILAGLSFLAGAATGQMFFFGCGMVTAAGFVVVAMIWDETYGG